MLTSTRDYHHKIIALATPITTPIYPHLQCIDNVLIQLSLNQVHLEITSSTRGDLEVRVT